MYTNENAPSTCGSRFSAASVRSAPCSGAKSSVTREASVEQPRKGRVRGDYCGPLRTRRRTNARALLRRLLDHLRRMVAPAIGHGLEGVEVREIAVVGQRHGAERSRPQCGLSVLEGRRARRRIAGVPDGDVPLQELEIAFVEHL